MEGVRDVGGLTPAESCRKHAARIVFSDGVRFGDGPERRRLPAASEEEGVRW